MISRYTRPEMEAVWAEPTKLMKWLEVELAALDALARYNYIPKVVPARVRKKASFDVKQVKKIEESVQHDVIAFLSAVAKRVGAEGRFLHFGLTSSDILDTALALQVREASQLILRGGKELLRALRKQARRHKYTIMVGRTHGVHAEPITFGLKLAVFYGEISRGLTRFERAGRELEYGKLSGAVGTFANVDPRVEAHVCRKLGLVPEPVSTQIIQRDRHAAYLCAVALLGCSLEKLATEIRNLQRTEVEEVLEPFGAGQKGSSAMPHKRNPILCERIAGLARLLRGYAVAAMENVALWHERDITHSSAERVIFPDATSLIDYMLAVMGHVVSGLEVKAGNMKANLEKSKGMVFSQGLLLALIRKGLDRNLAYRMVQNCAKKVWLNGRPFREVAGEDPELAKWLRPREIAKIFDYGYHTRQVNRIFQRVGI
jgi:adenylosuccinate lyase